MKIIGEFKLFKWSYYLSVCEQQSYFRQLAGWLWCALIWPFSVQVCTVEPRCFKLAEETKTCSK